MLSQFEPDPDGAPDGGACGVGVGVGVGAGAGDGPLPMSPGSFFSSVQVTGPALPSAGKFAFLWNPSTDLLVSTLLFPARKL